MLFEIDKEIISGLNDEMLRELIGRLCEADLFGTPANITYGGNQTAADGGVDVRVVVNTPNVDIGYIPRANVAYQSKAMDMPPSEIVDEMRPKNILRPIIRELAQDSGAYIIVSGKSNVSDTYLDKRKKAMRDCLSDCPGQENIFLDFFDAQRISTWVNAHRSVAVWLLDKLGMATYGWRGYGNWSNITDDETKTYLFDDALSVKYENRVMSTIDFINDMRIELNTSSGGKAIRIVGLSGVGKTRLIFELFDKRIGESPLDQHAVYYADCAKVEGLYSGIEKINELASGGIIILDNCKPEEHNAAREKIMGTKFTLITAEYDVQDETREDTDVYRVEPASDKLIAKVLTANFPLLHQTTIDTIISLSGGNFRLCKLLAKEIDKGEIIPRLRDTELFDRLFRQRNEQDKLLKKMTEVLSLVCSIDTETTGEIGELTIISQIAGSTSDELYRAAKELERREIAQRRGKYIAVLPHAIANRLAKTAIEDTRIDKLLELFNLPYPYRLLRSFSKRLAYLYYEPCVKEIVKIIFSQDELLGDITNVKNAAVLENLASILPEEALSAIERTVENKGTEFLIAREHSRMFERILRSIAYDDLLFNRAASLLVHIAMAKPTGFNPRNYGEFSGLFNLVLSGTNASPERKLNFIKSLIDTGDRERVLCACVLIENALDVSPTINGYDTFGTQERDLGFNPTRAEYNKWLNVYLDFVIRLCKEEDVLVAENAKEAIANKVQSFLRCGYINLVKKLKDVVWLDTYTGIELFLRYADDEQYSAEYLTQVNTLKNSLDPKALIDTMRIILLGNIVPEDRNEYNQELERLGERFFELTENERTQIVSEIFAKPNHYAFHFARGIAKKASNPKALWNCFGLLYEKAKDQRNSYNLLLGYVNGLSEISSTACTLILDDVVYSPVLKEIYPALQFEVIFDDSAMERLLNSIKTHDISARNYVFAFQKATLNDRYLLLLLNELSSLEDGVWAVINVIEIFMSNSGVSTSIKALAHGLLLKPGLLQLYKEHFFDITVGNLIKKSYALSETHEQLKELCLHIANEILKNQPSDISVCHHTMEAIIAVNSSIFLDVFFGEQFLEGIDCFTSSFMKNDWKEYILSKISDDIIIVWCAENPNIRNKTVAKAISFCQETEDGIVWSQIALFLILNTSNPVDVLNTFYFRFSPRFWSGSLADIMKKYVPLFDHLLTHEDKTISQWAIVCKKEFETRILREKDWEKKREYEHLGFAD